MSIDPDDLPDIIDVIPHDIDDDDDEEYQKALLLIRRYIKKNKLSLKKSRRLTKAKLQHIKRLSRDLNLLLLSEAYQSRQTYAGFIRRQEAIRRAILTSLLSGISEDEKIIVVTDLLRDLQGDSEPYEYYIW